MRVTCEACDGDGRSRDPMWQRCFDCCGRGDVPETAQDVRPSDIGMGVGFAINYTKDGRQRVSFTLTGIKDPPVIAIAPPTGELPYPYDLASEFAGALVTAWQTGNGQPLPLPETLRIAREITLANQPF